jgi:hypothetical protein
MTTGLAAVSVEGLDSRERTPTGSRSVSQALLRALLLQDRFLSRPFPKPERPIPRATRRMAMSVVAVEVSSHARTVHVKLLQAFRF